MNAFLRDAKEDLREGTAKPLVGADDGIVCKVVVEPFRVVAGVVFVVVPANLNELREPSDVVESIRL